MTHLYDIVLPVLSSNRRYDRLHLVTETSPQDERDAVEAIAWFFKREMRFDYVQFDAKQKAGPSGEPPYSAYLFLENAFDLMQKDCPTPYRVIGAACFRQSRDESWDLTWIWLHPYTRGKGLLLEHWSQFAYLHGEFRLEPPVSEAMAGFLRKLEQDSAE